MLTTVLARDSLTSVKVPLETTANNLTEDWVRLVHKLPIHTYDNKADLKKVASTIKSL